MLIPERCSVFSPFPLDVACEYSPLQSQSQMAHSEEKNARVSVMGGSQLSQVMATVSK